MLLFLQNFGFVVYVVVYSKLKDMCQKGKEKVFKPEIEIFLCWTFFLKFIRECASTLYLMLITPFPLV